jgi:putative nucleotidyltransferase with HDIG domain
MSRIIDPPLKKECMTLMETYEMLPNIRAHSLKVCEISLIIAEAINDAGGSIDCQLITAGALLHDITKTQCLKTHENHAKTGERLLCSLGYPKTAKIVAEHIIPEENCGDLTPSEIVAYADKRVLHDSVVSLDTRFNYLEETYGRHKQALIFYSRMRNSMDAIEVRIVKATHKSIDDLIPV